MPRQHSVGVNLFEIVLDLSFRRCGALLVYDPRHAIREHIRNEASIIWPDWMGKTPETEDVYAQALIGRSLEQLAMGEGIAALKSKRRLIELAQVDGAVIFDDQHLLAVGAILRAILPWEISWEPGRQRPNPPISGGHIR